MLVDALTDRWGVEPRRDGRGKTVWFECLAAKGPLSDRNGAPPAPRP